MTITQSIYVTGEVIQNKAWTRRLFSLKIRADQQQFKAGQFVRLRLAVNGEILAKPYSLVNNPDETDIEVLYNTIPNGKLSNALASLRPGDSIDVSQPASGFFVLDEIPESRELWMFATGTGLGPYISILKTAEVWRRFEKIVLVHGVPLREEGVYKELLNAWKKDRPGQFQFISSVTREPNPCGLGGRITEMVDSGVLEDHVGHSINRESSHIMLCGNHNMIDDMKRILAERGMTKHLRHKPGHITIEQYF